ncbi:MAG TPA: c-type cytochrome [Chitinophagaceae bacterium]|jgi:mono/diheme cytochrome c family protein
MKKVSIIALVITVIAALQSCSDIKRKPSRVYMPDMAYSRAWETYADHHSLTDSGIFYNASPVAGTVKRGDSDHYEIMKDTTGGYVTSVNLKNPFHGLDSAHKIEAERLYLVNCGICHGQGLKGDGPLHHRSDGTDGPYSPAPANFVDPAFQSGKYFAMAEGTMFFSITYGHNLMGSYASQVNPVQRWMIVSYIKSKQAAVTAAAAKPAAGDSTAKK